jgi:transposase
MQIFNQQTIRERGVTAVAGHKLTIKEASLQFKIGRRTVDRWMGEWYEEERLEGKSGYQKGHGYKIAEEDLEEFQQYIDANPNKTQDELGRGWKNPCKGDAIARGLRLIEYTYKKRVSV